MFNEDQADSATQPQPQPQEHKHSWLAGILEHVNTEFPLSGAETNNDLYTLFGHHEKQTQDQDQHPEQELESEHEHKHSWLANALGKIDAQFPLSGGE